MTEKQTSVPIDYRDLLKRYMRYVGECEGVHFIPSTTNRNPTFTQAEVDELDAFEDEIMISTAAARNNPPSRGEMGLV